MIANFRYSLSWSRTSVLFEGRIAMPDKIRWWLEAGACAKLSLTTCLHYSLSNRALIIIQLSHLILLIYCLSFLEDSRRFSPSAVITHHIFHSWLRLYCTRHLTNIQTERTNFRQRSGPHEVPCIFWYSSPVERRFRSWIRQLCNSNSCMRHRACSDEKDWQGITAKNMLAVTHGSFG